MTEGSIKDLGKISALATIAYNALKVTLAPLSMAYFRGYFVPEFALFE
jgi:hypothetical protein